MKIRNGFVSNSSSSSFILVYQKSSVVEGAEEIIKYVTENPNMWPLFRGRSLNEGDDYFELNPSMEALIRKFPDQFIEGTKNCEEPISLYRKARLFADPAERVSIDIDMSDVPFGDISSDNVVLYYKEPDNHPELKEQMDIRDRYYRIEEERREKKEMELASSEIEETKKEFVAANIPEDDIEVKKVWVDYSSLYSDGGDEKDFAERYFTQYYDAWRCNFLCNDSEARSYVLFYDELIEDREKIIETLERTCETSTNYLFFTDPVINSVDDDYDGVSVDYYEIGPEELAVLKKDFDKNTAKVWLATNASISAAGEGKTPSSSKYLVGYGRVAVIERGKDLIDFKEIFR